MYYKKTLSIKVEGIDPQDADSFSVAVSNAIRYHTGKVATIEIIDSNTKPAANTEEPPISVEAAPVTAPEPSVRK